jgi:hypothetical protein
MLPDGIECFAGDLSEEEKQIVWATATPPAADLFNEKAPGVAWRTKPSAYVMATKDHSVNTELHRFSAWPRRKSKSSPTGVSSKAGGATAPPLFEQPREAVA